MKIGAAKNYFAYRSFLHSPLSTCRFGREFESHFLPAGENGGREEGFSRQEELRLNFITQDLTTMSFHTALFVEKVPTKMLN